MLFFLMPLAFLWLGLLPQSQATQASQAPQSKVTDSTSSFADAKHLSEIGKYDEAIAQLESLRDQSPPPAGLSHELGIVYYKKSDYANAVLNLQKALAENPNDAEATQLIGICLYLAGRPGEAIPYLQKVLAWYPRANVDAAYILGVSYIQNKQYDEARQTFAKMFGFNGDSAAAYLFCGRIFFRLEFTALTEEYARKAVALDPKLPMAHYLLGELYLYQTKTDEAIAQFEQEIQLNPSYANVYFKLGDAYSRVERYDDAERLLQRSIWLDPNSSGPYIILGKVLLKKSEPELAARALSRAIAMDPGNPMAHQLLGQSYRALGQSADADRELRQAADLNRKPTKP
ncbi:MAG TPA: tetratricopeptide repeat protein [Candidatus Saccharimonadales bacterium]|nr:tetratricopeptide repeat protein [Candidatus Saccharimonadales bacterium]